MSDIHRGNVVKVTYMHKIYDDEDSLISEEEVKYIGVVDCIDGNNVRVRYVDGGIHQRSWFNIMEDNIEVKQ